MKVLTIGGATYDIFIGYTTPETVSIDTQSYIVLPEGQKIDLKSISYHSGGGATNSAASFARLGFNVSSFFKIGSDLQGKFIVDQLSKQPISLHHVISDKEKTSSSFIVSAPSGNSTVLVYRGTNSTITKDDINFDLISQQEQIYITSLSGSAAKLLPHITEFAHSKNIPVAVNPGGGQLKHGMQSLCDSLPSIDIFILNRSEAELFMNALKGLRNHFTIPQYMKTILESGPKIAVVTDGDRGVYVAHNDKILFHKSLPVDVVSTVGAGDAFGSCFVAQLARGKKIDDAIRAGIINSASVVGYLNAHAGLLNQETVEERLKKLDRTFLLDYFG